MGFLIPYKSIAYEYTPTKLKKINHVHDVILGEVGVFFDPLERFQAQSRHSHSMRRITFPAPLRCLV
jgi:hypothetical protein